MIWLREGNVIVGYAPALKKKYSDEEILGMSKYSYYEGWSMLSMLVMEIQGIEYIDDEDYGFAKRSVPKPMDVCDSFSFECSWEGLENKECMKTYIEQIYDVFQNLILYRIEQHSICDMKKIAETAKENMNLFISQPTIESLDKDIQIKIAHADGITKNLNELLSLFSNQGYPDLNLFDIPTEEILKYLNTERKIDKRLIYQ